MVGGLPTTAKRVAPRLALYAPLRSFVNAKEGHYSSSSPDAFSSLVEWLQQKHNNNNPAQRSNSGRLVFSGVEASLRDLGADGVEREESAHRIQEYGLELLVNLDVYGNANIQTNPPAMAGSLVESFENQLAAISNLGDVVTHVNCRTFVTSNKGSSPDTWDDERKMDYFLQVLPLSATFLEDHPHIGRNGNETDIMGGSPDHLTGISHETTIATNGLHHPDATRYILEVIPPLRLTMDLLSWQRACGYAWGSSNDDDDDDNEAETLSIEIAPHIDLIRTNTSLFSTCRSNSKTSATQGSNDDEIDSVNYDHYLRTHQSLWEYVWTRKANRGVEQLFVTLDDDCDAMVAGKGPRHLSRDGSHGKESRAKQLLDSAHRIHRFYDEWLSNSRFDAES
jgi:hypothetical protein